MLGGPVFWMKARLYSETRRSKKFVFPSMEIMFMKLKGFEEPYVFGYPSDTRR